VKATASGSGQEAGHSRGSVGDLAGGAVCNRSSAMLSGFRTETGATAYESDTCDVADVTAGADRKKGTGMVTVTDLNAAEGAKAPLVLVVEDYPDAREMYCEYLRFSGFRVAEARNGEEALEKAFTLLPDVVLMDLALPLMDGWEATRRLKSDRRTADILVVALTGHALAGHAEGARRAGCDAFVTKPCLPDDLVDEIRRLLDDRQAQPSGTPASSASIRSPRSALNVS
jgi:two-component system, cell cycle response regulator DivK